MIIPNQVDNMEICRDIAQRHNIPLRDVVIAVKHQYKVAMEHIDANDGLKVMLPRIGTFRKMKRFEQ